MESRGGFYLVVTVCILVLALSGGAHAQYAGGAGTPDDPYQITSPQDLIDLGNTPGDYDKHFILTADIDLSGITFDRAPIAPSSSSHSYFTGWRFTGMFSGNNHVIRNLCVEGNGYLGLFGYIHETGEVYDLVLENACIQGVLRTVGSLIGRNDGNVSNCHVTATVMGDSPYVGGLVAENFGILRQCYSNAVVTGKHGVGGLAATNSGQIRDCHSDGMVTGTELVSGLIGINSGRVADCYSLSTVTGEHGVGGLIGWNTGNVSKCYSAGTVTGNTDVGGLIGYNPWSDISDYNPGSVVRSFWNVESSGVLRSSGGSGLTTTEMMDPKWIGLQGWSNDPNWLLDPNHDYPRLAREGAEGQRIPDPVIDWMDGQGTRDTPYEVNTVSHLEMISRASLLWEKNLVLMTDLDVGEILWPQAVIPSFSGIFDGNGHTIQKLKVSGNGNLGLLGCLEEGGAILNLRAVALDIIGRGNVVGGLVGYNRSGWVSRCYVSGHVTGEGSVGGLVGDNEGNLSKCCSATEVVGNDDGAGGLAGRNQGNISNCYSTGPVTGPSGVGGLVGNNERGSVWHAYSMSQIAGAGDIGGLIGRNSNRYLSDTSGNVMSSFWDIESSGVLCSDGGVGLTTAEMQDIDTYLEVHWDFLGESANGTAETWQIPTVGSYPALNQVEPVAPEGQGTATTPFLITSALELGSTGWHPLAYYRLNADIDLSNVTWTFAVVPWFGGYFDGNGHVIRHLQIQGGGPLGLFGFLAATSLVSNVRLEDCLIQGSESNIGALAGHSKATLLNCCNAGSVTGLGYVGGLVGMNDGNMSRCHSTCTVTAESIAVGGLAGGNFGNVSKCHSTATISGGPCYSGGLLGCNEGNVSMSYSTATTSGDYFVGGLIGDNDGSVSCCRSTATVAGQEYLGGLAGTNSGDISNCYSTGIVTGSRTVGGLIGMAAGTVLNCYSTTDISRGWRDYGGLIGWNTNCKVENSFWDVKTSNQNRSEGGTGLTTAEMWQIQTYLRAGWDFVGETENGEDDLWWIDDGQDYPHLGWEDTDASL